MTVMIGVDPHKRSHTAVAIDGDEVELARIEVRASEHQTSELLGWAARFETRTWAVEGAGGLGYLLAQQLVAAGERVLDVPATLAARVRVLATSRSNKNDANDGYSIAVAALHATGLAEVRRADHATVLRVLAKRNRELGSAWTRTACRLHAVLVDLVPGGISKEITANRAAELLAGIDPKGPVEAARYEVALEHLDDLRRIDDQLRASKRRLAAAVSASGTSVTELFGFGPVGAAIAIGHARAPLHGNRQGRLIARKPTRKWQGILETTPPAPDDATKHPQRRASHPPSGQSVRMGNERRFVWGHWLTTRMPRAAVVVATAVLVMASAAGADVSRVTGSAHGTEAGPRLDCPDYPMSLSGTIATAHGPAKLLVQVCYDYDGGYEVTGGDFVIRQGDGHARGSLTGIEHPGHNSLDFDYTLIVKNCTAGFPAPGTKLHFRGTETYSGTTGNWRGRVASK